jgi:hypothetical protein
MTMTDNYVRIFGRLAKLFFIADNTGHYVSRPQILNYSPEIFCIK